MITQPSSSRSKLVSHEDRHLVAHSISLRRLLSRLDKTELVSLVTRWLDNAGPSYIPPMLSRRQPKAGEEDPASNLTLFHAILDLNEERRCRSMDELRLLWTGPMADPKVPKARALDRIADVDWPEGLSYAMVAELDLFYMHARQLSKTWTTVRLEYDDEVDAAGRGWERLNETQIRARLGDELGHYFEHHIYLHPRGKEESMWTDHFSYFRIVLAPTPSDVCGTGLHILHLPRTPFLLVSGSLGRGSENREMALSAFASAAGATTVNYAKPSAGSTAAKKLLAELNDAGEDAAGNRRTLGELRGKDPMALRAILLHESGRLSSTSDSSAAPAGVAGGGKARQMTKRNGGAEDGPLVAPLKRRKEDDLSAFGIAPPTPPTSASESDSVSLSSTSARRAQRRHSPTPGVHAPHETTEHARAALASQLASQREANDLFGPAVDANDTLPRIERIEYELHLPFPNMQRYNTRSLVDMTAYNADPERPKIRLRLEGTHVLAGLRKVVAAGLDRRTTRLNAGEEEEEGGVELDGLPGWLTEVRGTKVVVLPPPAGDDSSRDM
ncbi:Centromere protein Chl4/mis15/CENP-N [Kalmanozyma brasiliensis GHG001]|uniref:Chromosome segregation protein n=1 Tax=Kalmanozyma brasiliensis (strain GHG001) TaxID=1365824 RepID=V5ETY7_KALBG|nr:Centromere protein Chl4/mis15/CENP-N [Kalmanozyma brasiliensis GHG001]EST05519.1 Centromere protein Chl4/mis15/CENP-N [Kalmanozyma brasiliensis GHG001]